MAKGLPFFPGCQVLAEINWNNLHGWDLNPSHIIAFSTLSLSFWNYMVELLLSAGASCTVRPFIANLIKWPQKQCRLGSLKTVSARLTPGKFANTPPRRLLNQTSVHPKGKCYASGLNHLFPKPSSSRAPGAKKWRCKFRKKQLVCQWFGALRLGIF